MTTSTAGPAGESPALSVSDLSISYGGVTAVRDAALHVNASESVVLLGPNGAGKTSLLRAISGAVPVGGGRVTFHGVDITGRRPNAIRALGLAHVLEGNHVFDPLTVAEHLRLGVMSTPRAERAERSDVSLLFDRLPVLYQKRDQRARELSGGQKKLLAIASALVSRPTILLIDEPSFGLAPVMLETVAGLIDWAQDEFGMTMLIVEQHVALGLSLAQRAYVLVAGEVVAEAASSDLTDGEVLRSLYFGGSAKTNGAG